MLHPVRTHWIQDVRLIETNSETSPATITRQIIRISLFVSLPKTLRLSNLQDLFLLYVYSYRACYAVSRKPHPSNYPTISDDVITITSLTWIDVNIVNPNFILATTPSAFRRWAGRGREYESHVHVTWSTTLLSFRASKFFDNSSLLVRFRCLGCDQICLSIRKLSAGALYRNKDGVGSPWKVFIIVTFDPCIFSEIHTF